MTPIPAPDPVPLPAPLGVLQALLVFTFVLHLIAMNLVVGGTALTVVSLLRRQQALARQLARMLPAATALTITFGVAPLLFLQTIYGQFFYASSILMAGPWFLIVPMLIVAYYAIYYNYLARAELTPRHLWAAALSAALVMVIAGLYTHNLTLMLAPERWAALSPAASTLGWNLNTGEPTLLPRFLHFIVASFAVTGLFLAWRGSVKLGALLFIGGTLVNLGVGLWFLAALPEPVRGAFLGGNLLQTSLLWSGAGLAVAAMLLSLVALPRARPRGWLAGASGCLLGTIALMATTRHFVRELSLAPHWDVAALPVKPMWDVFAVFAGLLVVGVAVVGWMTLQVWQAGNPKHEIRNPK